MTKEKIPAQCIKCNDIHLIIADSEDVKQWVNGALIQDAMPYLSPDEREILISGICGMCFERMFGEGGDMEWGDDDECEEDDLTL